MKKTILLLLVIANTALADESSVKYGLGVFNSAVKSGAEVKALSLTWQRPLINENIIDQYELGILVDNAGGGRSSTGFGFYSAGVNVNAGYVFVQSLLGVGLITTPDTYLGGPFQFTEDFAAGLKDHNGYSIGLDYKHISSAGIESPNQGRDLMLLRVSIPW